MPKNSRHVVVARPADSALRWLWFYALSPLAGVMMLVVAPLPVGVFILAATSFWAVGAFRGFCTKVTLGVDSLLVRNMWRTYHVNLLDVRTIELVPVNGSWWVFGPDANMYDRTARMMSCRVVLASGKRVYLEATRRPDDALDDAVAAAKSISPVCLHADLRLPR